MLLLTTMPWADTVSSGHDDVESAGNLIPSPDLTPAEVVRIQLKALRHNKPSNDGIALTYGFASPANKAATGPLERFVGMLTSAPYDRLLNHREVRVSPVTTVGTKAHQILWVTDVSGEQVGYVWVLARQSDGRYKDCWMTDAVYPSRPLARRKLVAA